jgi:hypothetical protein
LAQDKQKKKKTTRPSSEIQASSKSKKSFSVEVPLPLQTLKKRNPTKKNLCIAPFLASIMSERRSFFFLSMSWIKDVIKMSLKKASFSLAFFLLFLLQRKPDRGDYDPDPLSNKVLWAERDAFLLIKNNT